MSEESFVFYPSWRRTIKSFESDSKERAYDLAMAIIDFGITGEIKSDDPIIVGVVDGMCRDVMNKAKKRRAATISNGGRGGRPKQGSDEDLKKLRDAGLLNQEIADNLGCTVKTIERRLEALDSEI